MTLSDAVLDTKGNILLPQGTQLNDAMLASLLRHQIATVVVNGGEVSAEEIDAERDHRIARVAYLFRPAGRETAALPDSVATDALHQYVLRYRSSTLT